MVVAVDPYFLQYALDVSAGTLTIIEARPPWQTRVVATERLGPSAGRLTGRELSAVEEALALVLDL